MSDFNITEFVKEIRLEEGENAGINLKDGKIIITTGIQFVNQYEDLDYEDSYSEDEDLSFNGGGEDEYSDLNYTGDYSFEFDLEEYGIDIEKLCKDEVVRHLYIDENGQAYDYPI